MEIYGHPDEWSEEHQSCAKHGIPMLPCPQCLAEENPNIIVVLDAMDRDAIAWGEVTLKEIMPADHSWLIDRVQ
jgi:predicted transporter